MSVQAVGWALDQYIKDAATKLVLISLANYADKRTGECWPTIARICEESCQSKSTVLRRMEWLIERGLVTKIAVKEASGRQRPNIYRLNLSVTLLPDDEVVGAAPNGGGCLPDTPSDTPGGVTADTHREPLEEPSVSPIAPKGAGVGDDRDQEEARQAYGEFIAWYAPPPTASLVTPLRHWLKLSAEDRTKAMAAVGPYKAACAAEKPKPRKPLDPSAYLSRRIFDNFNQAVAPRPPEHPALPMLRQNTTGAKDGFAFVALGSEEWSAWKAAADEAGYPLRAVVTPPRPLLGIPEKRTGIYLPQRWPPNRDGPDRRQQAAGE